ncbi:hypothetical protein [Vibrio marisflavi]|uniref:Ecp2 effector protein domain-containing protein n=1 Tax=Vibrio marisflavi CECT 7928 TaxID=634439 RepID=A0ABN8E0K4_9VIBR|nr:hypothetical protein [Vibrio marisflavi]CAH0537773.1 hypothetical protein VMF7928_01326 [Vibrio marisflavi CECT 7928]
MRYLALLAFSIPFVAQAKPLPECKPDQIQIRHLAIETPGMSQTNDYYGILNRSNSACSITRLPVSVLPIETKSTRHSKLEKKVDSNPAEQGRFDLYPIHNQTQILDSLVWFKVHGAGACDGQEGFNQLAVKLSSNNPTNYVVPFNGYTACGVANVAQLHQGKKGWPTQCFYDGKYTQQGKLTDNVSIGKLASCG